MNQIMTLYLPDGEELEVVVTTSIVSSDFFSFMGRIGTQAVEARVESEDNYNDRKSRGC